MLPNSHNSAHLNPRPPASGAGPVSAQAGAGCAPVGSALGIHAKFQATRNHAGFRPSEASGLDFVTGEIKGLKDAIQSRLERFALQSAVREILPKSRTANCLRLRQKNSSGVDVFLSQQHRRAHYGGLQTCASVWACPVCAAKISERRRQELHQLLQAHKEAGGVVLFITRTAPHCRTDDLGDLLAQLAQAEASYKAHRDYKTLSKALGVVGTVRTVEVTWGEANGFHPHVHELVLISQPVSIPDFEEDLFRIWKGSAVRAGFSPPSRAHGLTVQNGDHAAKYVSKWGLESEMTQWHRKRGKVASLTPFDLLRWYLQDGSKQAAQLFRIYAESFHGRHQLQYSRGLKKLYDIADSSDEDLAAMQDDDALLLGSLTVDQWRLVVGHGQRGALLEVAALRGWEGVEDMLAGLVRHHVPPDPCEV